MKHQTSAVIRITDHASRRSKERVGIKSKPLLKMARQAFDNGLTLEDTAGRLKKFLQNLMLPNDNRVSVNNIKIYNELIWLFKGEILITIIHLPVEFKRTVKKCKNQSLPLDHT